MIKFGGNFCVYCTNMTVLLQDNMSMFHYAADGGDVVILKELIKSGLDVNASNNVSQYSNEMLVVTVVYMLTVKQVVLLQECVVLNDVQSYHVTSCVMCVWCNTDCVVSYVYQYSSPCWVFIIIQWQCQRQVNYADSDIQNIKFLKLCLGTKISLKRLFSILVKNIHLSKFLLVWL